MSAPGGSDVDNAYDHEQYRYIAIGGPVDVSGHEFLASEIALMFHRGWTDASAIPREEGDSGTFVPTSYTTPGAIVEFNSPTRQVKASLLVVPDAYTAAVDQSGSPIGGNATPVGGNSAVVRALARHEPVLWVVLGNGKAR